MTGLHIALLLASLLFADFVHAGSRERYAISEEQVLTQLHLHGTAVDIALPQVTSQVPDSRLLVVSEEREGTAIRLRLRCAEGACLPFYATLRFRTANDAEALLARLRVSTNLANKSSTLIRQGSPTVLEIVMGQVRIRINVKCLQSGSQGDMIRVRDEQTQRIYLASVVDKNHVRVER